MTCSTSSRHEDGPGAIVLRVRVQPGAGRAAVTGRHGDALALRVAAPPIGGRANAQCLEFVADVFGVRKSQVELVSGEKSRQKRLRVTGDRRRAGPVTPSPRELRSATAGPARTTMRDRAGGRDRELWRGGCWRAVTARAIVGHPRRDRRDQMVPTTVVAADNEKGAVVKANASKAASEGRRWQRRQLNRRRRPQRPQSSRPVPAPTKAADGEEGRARAGRKGQGACAQSPRKPPRPRPPARLAQGAGQGGRRRLPASAKSSAKAVIAAKAGSSHAKSAAQSQKAPRPPRPKRPAAKQAPSRQGRPPRRPRPR